MLKLAAALPLSPKRKRASSQAHARALIMRCRMALLGWFHHAPCNIIEKGVQQGKSHVHEDACDAAAALSGFGG